MMTKTWFWSKKSSQSVHCPCLDMSSELKAHILDNT